MLPATTAARPLSSHLSTGAGDPSFLQLNLRVPVPVKSYVDETLELACALLGGEVGQDACINAILAEASTEIHPTVDAHDIHQIATNSDGQNVREGTKADRQAPGPSKLRSLKVLRGLLPRSPQPSDRPSAAASGPFPSRPFPAFSIPSSMHDRRRAAHILHRWILRQCAQLDQLRVRREDLLVDMLEDGVHEKFGYRQFTRFAADGLDCSASTVWAYLRAAGQRRRHDPIACARAEGRLRPVAAEMLDRLCRQCHVPSSFLEPWIDFARTHTTRRLRQAVRWARVQRDTDYRRWSLRGCPLPTEEDLRTMNRPLEDIAAEASPVSLQALADAPYTELSLVLQRETHELLLQLAASLVTDTLDRTRRIPPAWWPLLQIFHLARSAWMVHATELDIPIPRRRRVILQRDGWRCRAPECTRRRNLQEHHIQFRSRGGGEEETNRITLCAFHHLVAVHGGFIRLTGQADATGQDLHWDMGLDAHGRPARVYQGERIVR